MILIVGATGRTGSVAALDLVKQGLPVRAMVRNPAKAATLAEAGVEIVRGDHGDAESIRSAMAGVRKLAIILPNGENQLRWERKLVDLAADAGVEHIVKLSSMEATASATLAVHRMHWESEQHIRAKGVPWTMVRGTFYMQNFLSCARTIKADGRFGFPCGENGAAAFIDARDVGAMLAHVLATPGHAGKSYDVTSRDRLKFSEAAAVLAEVLERPVIYVPQSMDEYRQGLAKVLASTWHVNAVCDVFEEIAEGYVADLTDTFEQVMGRPPISLRQFVRDHRAAFT